MSSAPAQLSCWWSHCYWCDSDVTDQTNTSKCKYDVIIDDLKLLMTSSEAWCHDVPGHQSAIIDRVHQMTSLTAWHHTHLDNMRIYHLHCMGTICSLIRVIWVPLERPSKSLSSGAYMAMSTPTLTRKMCNHFKFVSFVYHIIWQETVGIWGAVTHWVYD